MMVSPGNNYKVTYLKVFFVGLFLKKCSEVPVISSAINSILLKLFYRITFSFTIC